MANLATGKAAPLELIGVCSALLVYKNQKILRYLTYKGHVASRSERAAVYVHSDQQGNRI